MRHGHVHAGRAGREQQPAGLGQGAPAAGHIVDQDHSPALHGDVWQPNLDLQVAVAHLVAHGVVKAVGGCSPGDPGRRLAVGADQQRLLQLRGDPVAQQRGARERNGLRRRHRLVQRGDTVQVRVHRDDGVKLLGQPLAQDALAHGFAGPERHVLPHVGQVGADQGQVPGAQRTGGGRGEHQFGDFVAGLVQPAQDHHTLGQLRRQAQADLAVRKAVALDRRGLQAGGRRQPQGQRGFVVKVEQHGHGGVQNSTKTCGTSCAAPMR